jgi:hypothetical protein
MPNKKHLSNVHHAAHVLAARAGLIPASDYIENELNLRAARIGRTVSAYARRDGRHDLAITGFLQDLRHYCDSKGLVFHELDSAAHEYYLEDVNESPWISRPHAS